MLSTIDILQCIVHGAGFIFLILMSLVMLLSHRSLFSHAHNRKSIRIETGITLLCWALTFLDGIVFLIINHEGNAYLSNLNMLIDGTLTLPLTMHLFYAITYLGKPKFTWTTIEIPFCLALIICYALTGEILIFYLTIASWFTIGFIFDYVYLRNVKHYKRVLSSAYSDYRGRELKWLNYGFLAIMLYLTIYVIGSFVGQEWIWFISFAFLIIAWGYVFYFVDTQDSIHDAEALSQQYKKLNEGQAERQESTAVPSPKDAPSPKDKDHQPTKEVAQPETTTPPVKQQAEQQEEEKEQQLEEKEDYRGIGGMLRKHCEEAQLYRQSGLTITDLASAVGTNRTYLWEYFKLNETNFHTYINLLRVGHAKRMIEENPESSLTLVCNKSGFGSESSFRRIFTEHVGCSPAQYVAQVIK